MLLYFSFFLRLKFSHFLFSSLIGVIKGVLTTLVGFFTFGGQPVTVMAVIGITLNAVGGVLYSLLKYFEKKKVASSKITSAHSAA